MVFTVILCVVYRLFYFKFGIYTILYNSDTVTYFTNFNIINGKIDLYRTPIYPFILKLLENISFEHFIRNLILFQHFVSFLSLFIFYKSVQNITSSKYIASLTTLIFGCLSIILDQIKNINPESLSITGSVLSLYLLSSYINSPTKTKAFSFGFLPFILIMLKPNFLILLIVTLLFILFRFFIVEEEKSILKFAGLGWILACIFLLLYCSLNKKLNNEFTLSKISLNNSISNIVKSGAYTYGGDPELISLANKTKNIGYYKYYTTVFTINNEFIDYYKIHYKNKIIQNYPPSGDMLFCYNIPDTKNYSSKRINNFINNSQKTFVYLKYIIYRIFNILTYKVALSFIMLIQLFLNVYLFLKYKKLEWEVLFSILFVLSQFLTIAINGINDWERLLLPCYPFMILIVFSFFLKIIKLIKNKNLVFSS